MRVVVGESGVGVGAVVGKSVGVGARVGPGGVALAGTPMGNGVLVVVSELTVDQRRELNVSGGLVIDDIRNNAARADLRPGDLILAIIARGESTEIKSVEQFNKLLAPLDKSASVTLLVRRGDQQTFVTIKGLPDRRAE